MAMYESNRLQRLYDAVAQNPKNCRFDDIARLLKACGFTARKTSGSHVIFKKGALAISVPKAIPVKETYVKQVLALLEQL
jgi:predicted RNA binding protein YcfA (HicA-like mRNA interferase family)